MKRYNENKLRFMIYNNYTINEISKEFGIAPKNVIELINLVHIDKKTYDNFMRHNSLISASTFNISKSNVEKICLTSDFHYTSVYDHPEYVEKIYDICEENEIKYILNTGDLTNGHYPKEENYKNNNRVIGVDNTVEYVINEHPYNKNIEFYFIGGNHDNSFWRNDGVDIGEKIDKKRPDIHYLGYDSAYVNIGNVKIYLEHGFSKSKNNINTRFKYYYNKYKSNNVDVLALGHIHIFGNTNINNTLLLQLPCMIDLLPHLQNIGYNSEIGAYIVEFKYDETNKLISKNPYEIVLDENKELVRKRM